MIESAGNPLAFNHAMNARGLMQITPVVLTEYNTFNHTQISEDNLFNPAINEGVGTWYLMARIPQLLKHYHKKITVRNIIISYNAGIGWAGKRNIPSETKAYIAKYKRLSKKGII